MIDIKISRKAKGSKTSQATVINTTAVSTAAKEATHAAKSDYATRAAISDLATSAKNLTSDSSDWQAIADKINAAIAELSKVYLSKVSDDTAQGLITFLEGLKVGDGFSIDKLGNAVLNSVKLPNALIDAAGKAVVKALSSSDFDASSETGFNLSKGDNGYSLSLKNLVVWGKAIFNQLEIRKVSYVGGNFVFSPAGGTISLVKEEKDGYKCYLYSDDGTTATMNMFAVDDQVLCQSFNIKAGVYKGVANKRYWRRITAVSDKDEEINGKKYSWVMVSKSDCEKDSDIPATGDAIVVRGNRTNKDRQNFIEIDTQSEGSPSIAMYKGVDSYSLTNKNKIHLSPSKVRIVTDELYMTHGDGDTVRVPVDMGEWDGSAVYYDRVSYQGSLWLCIAPEGTTVTEAPSEDSDFWRKQVSKGVDGVNGKDGAKGTDGKNASLVSLTATSQVLVSPATGGATSPATATVTGMAINTAITVWQYSVNGGAFSATVPAGVTRKDNAVTVTGSSMTASTISIRMADANGVADTLTVAKVTNGKAGTDGKNGATGATGANGKDGVNGKDGANGADAYTILLTNEAHVFSGGVSSAVAGSTTSEIVAYKGATRVAATIGTITGQVTGLTTAITNNGKTNAGITITVTTALTALSGVLTIPITVDGKAFTKTLAWSVSRTGAKGADGKNGTNGKDGATGATGKTGANGISIKTVDVYYYLSTSNTKQDGGKWDTLAPAWADGKYMWSKTITTYSNGSTTESKPVCITGAKGSTGDPGKNGTNGTNGKDGAKGATGTGVASITEEYSISTSKATAPTSGWRATPPAWSTGKYIWTRSKIVYKDPASTVYTTPVCSSEWEAVNNIQVGGRNLLKNTAAFLPDDNPGAHKKKGTYKGLTVAYTTGTWYLSGFTAELEAGKEYIFSYYAKGTSRGHGESTRNAEKDSIEREYTYTPLTEDWKRYSRPLKCLINTNAAFGVAKQDAGSDLYTCGYKLEEGNKATDWTPAPEDTIPTLELSNSPMSFDAGSDGKVAMNNNTCAVTYSQNEVTGAIPSKITLGTQTNCKATLKDNVITIASINSRNISYKGADGKAQNVSVPYGDGSVDFTAVCGYHTIKGCILWNLKANVFYDSLVSNKEQFEQLKGKVEQNGTSLTQMETKISQKADSVTLTATKTDLQKSINTVKSDAEKDATTKANNALNTAKTDATNKANTAQANAKTYTEGQFKVANDNISLAVTKIQVGSRNLLQDTQKMARTDYWNLSFGSVYGTVGEFTARKTTVQWGRTAWIPSGRLTFEKGKTYTLSFWAKRDASKETKPTLLQYFIENTTKMHYVSLLIDSVSQVVDRNSQHCIVPLSTNYQRFVMTVEALADYDGYDFRPEFYTEEYQTNTPCGVIYGFCLVEGNKDSGWSPSPEDVPNALKRTGIDLDEGTIAMQADNFTLTNVGGEKTLFVNSDGDMELAGVVKAKALYRTYGDLIADDNGQYLAEYGPYQSSPTETSWQMPPDIINAKCNVKYAGTTKTFIVLPWAGYCVGRMIDIYGVGLSGNASQFTNVNVISFGEGLIWDGATTRGEENFVTIGSFRHYGVILHPFSTWQLGNSHVKLLATQDAFGYQWTVLDMNNAEIQTTPW